METIHYAPVIYSLGSEFADHDFVDTTHIKNVVMDRVMKQAPNLQGQFIYLLTLDYTLARTDYHSFTLEKFQDISRRLTNGMMSLGMISNRKFWNDHFSCGVRTTSICDYGTNDFPTFSFNYLMCGLEDNLDVKMMKQLTLRIRMIEPKLKFTFQFIGQFTPELYGASINYQTSIGKDNPTIERLEENTLEEIYHNQFQRPRFLGGLYKLKPSTI